jgi:hypothetical protein
MSPSEPSPAEPGVDPAQLASQLERLAARTGAVLTEPGAGVEVTEQDLRRLVSAGIRLYAAVSEQAAADIVPIDAEVSTTDAVVLACALLKARELNPFDLALWFSRTRTAG